MRKSNKQSEIEKLKAEVERLKKELKKRKKYGLVWEDKPEDVVEMCKEKLPILKEVKSKEIITDPKEKQTFYGAGKEKPVNLLIEGDNYHTLSVLNYTHQKKVDVIYIDPPYNTGNKDFIFNDRYVDKEDAYRHSKWLSFMEKRLRLARNLLKDTGVIFISIDDNEVAQLKLLMDEIFGEKNFIACLPTVMNLKGNQDQFGFAGTHEYTLVYCRNQQKAKIGEFLIDEEDLENWDQDEYGYFKKGANLKATGVNAPREKRPNLYFPIFITNEGEIYTTTDNKPRNKNDIKVLPITDNKEMSWRWSKEKIEKEKHNLLVEKNKSGIAIYKKQRPKLGGLPTKKPKTLFYKPEYSSGSGTELLKNMFGEKRFNNPKPLQLIKDLIFLATGKKGLVLDFMAGSGTTGHAVLELNKEDGGERKFILCSDNQDNNGGGFKIVTDVCYPRIEKVIHGYIGKKDKKRYAGLGGNLKYFKTDFVDAEPTDKNKIKLTKKATEMLCIKEGTFNLVQDRGSFKIFKNSKHYTGIIFDQSAIPEFKKAIKDVKGRFSVYIFSLGDETFEDEFQDIKQKVKLSPIPEVILRVYRRIFK